MSSPWALPPANTEGAFFNAARPTVVLIVEGGTDERFWRSHVGRGCRVHPLHPGEGREHAIAEVATAQREGRPYVIAVLDADFDRVHGTLPDGPNLFFTDAHDLETMLILSPALEKVLHEHGSVAKIEALGRSVREHLLELGLHLGRFRLLNQRDGLRLSFRKLKGSEFSFPKYEDAVSPKTWAIDLGALITAVLNFSNRHGAPVSEIRAGIDRMPATPIGQLCNGHDLLLLLVIGLRSKIGSKNIAVEDLSGHLRMAYEFAWLAQTELGRALRRWEQANPPFQVLRTH